MRIAMVSDIHGNLTAFEAVLADLRETSPDLILHGGDLAHGGASPAEIVDRIRELAWPGVLGNTDEMLFRPESLQEFASQSLKLQPTFAKMFAMIEEMATEKDFQIWCEVVNDGEDGAGIVIEDGHVKGQTLAAAEELETPKAKRTRAAT